MRHSDHRIATATTGDLSSIRHNPGWTAVSTLALTAALAAGVLAGRRSRAQLRRRNAELSALHETTLGLLEGLDVTALLETIVGRAADLLGTDHGYIYLVEPAEDVLRVAVASGRFTPRAGYATRRGEGVSGRVWETGATLAVDDYSAWAGRKPDLDREALRAVAGVPLREGSEVIGVLGLALLERGRTFQPSELALLERFGRLASLALQNARLYDAARRELEERRQAEEDLQDVVVRLKRSESDLQTSHEEMIRRLSYAAEFRDAATGRHIERMSRYCTLLGTRLGLEHERCDLLRVAATLHDVGKIGIPDSILLKPGPLDPNERRTIERHAEMGYRLLAGSGSELLELAATIAWTHHEHYDGAGYPRGLAGETIPLEGRIASVADVFDALTTDRVYRPAFTLADALRMMEEGRGTQFDPLILDLFLDSADEVAAIRQLYEPDSAEGPARHASGTKPAEPLEAPTPPRMPAAPRRRAVRTDATSHGPLSAAVLEVACEEAFEALVATADDRQAIDAALSRLRAVTGPELHASLYLRDHDRLWCMATRGYDEVRDGFSLDRGVMARAVRTGLTQFIPQAHDDPDFIPSDPGSLLSEVAVPFGDAAPADGVLNIETRRRALPVEAEWVFSALTREIGKRAIAARGDLGLDLAALARLSVYASSLRGVSSIAEFATRTLGRLLELDSSQLNLTRDGHGYSLASFWRTLDSERRPFSTAELARIEEAIGPGGAAYGIHDLHALGLEDDPESSGRWLLWLPLRTGGSEIGTLIGRSARPLSFAREQAEAATLFAQHAAAQLDVAQALRREQRAAVTEPLTGLLNRRGLDERFREELRRAERAGTELSVVIFDTDDLKAINDLGGHQLGDLVLQGIARFLTRNKRSTDIAARLGGDEFALVLPEVGTAEALAAAERLRLGLVDQPSAGGRVVAASFGIATFPTDGTTTTDLLRAADRALYRAKQEGKNRTVAFGRTGEVLHHVEPERVAELLGD
jgi:diguanylate cyclase (GGDEF)-like protein